MQNLPATRCGSLLRRSLAIGAGAVLLASTLSHALAAVPSAGSAGCGRAAPTGLFARAARDGNKTLRSYLVEVPSDYSATRPYALIFVFHAAGGGPDDARAWGLQDAPGARGNGIFVFPKGIDYQHEGPGWDDRSDGYDLPFFDHMLDDLAAAYCIDRDRVFVTGFSWGGDFSVALACRRGAAIRAVAADSTSDEFKDPADFMTYQDLPCPGPRHPAIRFVHAEGADEKYPAPYFATTSRLLRFLNRCAPASLPVPSASPAMNCVAFRGCASETVECSFDRAIGHALPPHWAADTWTFFAQR